LLGPRADPAVADLAQGLLRFTRLAARTDLQRPWLTPDAEVLDGQTWESWIRRNPLTPGRKAGLGMTAGGYATIAVAGA